MLPTIASGNVASAISGAYEVANSCRFNRADSSYMHKTPGGAGDQQKFTFSFWIKKCGVDTLQTIFDTEADDDNQFKIVMNANGTLTVESKVSDHNDSLTTTQLFRDPMAWYHICAAYDTTQGTDTNRVKLYVNGTQVTAFNTSNYPAEDLNTLANAANKLWVGASAQTSNFCDMYIAEFCLIDGQQLTPTSFGEFDEDSPNIFKPIDVSGLTFGTNGFYLDFEDSSNLGNDAKGGTDLTEVNLDATDQATDSPTNNFCTLNPLSNVPADTNTVSEGNCKWVMSAEGTTSTFAMSTGKWYMEYKVGSPTTNWTGVQEINADIATQYTSANKSATLYLGGATAYINGSNQGSGGYGSAWSSGDVGMLAFDADNARIYFGKDGSWWDTDAFDNASPTTYLTATTGKIYYFRFVKGGNTSCTYEANFGGCSAFTVSSANQDANGYGNFEFAVPSGYFALCTKNLAEHG